MFLTVNKKVKHFKRKKLGVQVKPFLLFTLMVSVQP